MADEERIKLMTRMTSYENNEGRDDIRISGYFRSDYVGFHMLRAVVMATVAFAVCIGVYVFCNIDTYITEFYSTDFYSIARKFVSYYLVAIAVYAAVAYIVYTYRYSRAKRRVRTYQRALKKLASMSGKQ